MTVDLSWTIQPKSDQINADDLINGPLMITVTGVAKCAEPEQPIAISFQGEKRVYKPGKSMRRVLVKAWGSDGAAYVGRSMTLYRDDKVRFGGFETGGIRISHMSHIPGPFMMALTESKAKRKPFTVQPLSVSRETPTDEELIARLVGALKDATTAERVQELMDSDAAKGLVERHPDNSDLMAAWTEALARTVVPPATETPVENFEWPAPDQEKE